MSKQERTTMKKAGTVVLLGPEPGLGREAIQRECDRYNEQFRAGSPVTVLNAYGGPCGQVISAWIHESDAGDVIRAHVVTEDESALTPPDAFALARERHLDQLDLLYCNLRELAGDPNWVNDAWPALQKATQDMIAQLAVIRRLNEASVEAEANP